MSRYEDFIKRQRKIKRTPRPGRAKPPTYTTNYDVRSVEIQAMIIKLQKHARAIRVMFAKGCMQEGSVQTKQKELTNIDIAINGLSQGSAFLLAGRSLTVGGITVAL